MDDQPPASPGLAGVLPAVCAGYDHRIESSGDLGALGVFWLLSAALGIWLARRVTRPLRLLAGALPHLGTENELPVVPSDRRDEIGQLARALITTHQTLNDERERRRAAERLALLGRMTASLAHEVRNTVAAIQMHAQLLEGASPEESAMSRGHHRE